MVATAAQDTLTTGVREGEVDDVSFIMSSWLRHSRHSSPFARSIRSSIFFEHHHDLIEELLRDGARVLVAHVEDDPSTILAYVVYELGEIPVLHFAFCKPMFRRIGLFTKLLDAAGIDPEKEFFVSHWTDTCFALSRKWPSMIHNPYAFLSR